MSNRLEGVWRHRELLQILVSRNLKIRYKNSVLGFFWSLLGPLLLILIYTVFLRVMRFDIDLPTLVTGIIVWQFLALCLGDSLHAVVGNANLVTKARFPRILLPIAMVCANAVNFLLSSCVLLLYLGLTGVLGGALYFLPLVLAAQLALCLGVGMLVSCVNVYFRDSEHVLQVVTLAWFFLTPVIYPAALVTGNADFPAWISWAFFANPMTGIVESYRSLLLSHPLPEWPRLALSFGMAGVAWLVGWGVFTRGEPGFGDAL